MLSQPHKRISERALTVWRITGVIITLFLLLILGGVMTLIVLFDGPVWISVVAIILFLLTAYIASSSFTLEALAI